MTCGELSDRMPGVVRGTDAWTAVEADHLRTCPDCRAEWTVVMAGAGVAESVTPDAELIAARVLERLRTEPVAVRPIRGRWLAGLAAAAVIAVVLLSRREPPQPTRGPADARLTVDLPGLESLDAAELERVLDAVDAPWTETSTVDSPSLDDLNDQELARVARAWES